MIENLSQISGWVAGITSGGFLAALAIIAREYNNRVRLGTEARVADDGIADKQWARVHNEIARLDRRVDDLTKEVEECRKREGEWISRAITAEAEVARLEAINLGRGQVNQEVQRLESTARLSQRKKSS